MGLYGSVPRPTIACIYLMLCRCDAFSPICEVGNEQPCGLPTFGELLLRGVTGSSPVSERKSHDLITLPVAIKGGLTVVNVDNRHRFLSAVSSWLFKQCQQSEKFSIFCLDHQAQNSISLRIALNQWWNVEPVIIEENFVFEPSQFTIMISLTQTECLAGLL